MKFENQVRADVVQRRGAQHREDAHLAHALLEAFDNMFGAKGAFLEKFFHQGIVALGYHFHQRFVGLLGGFGQVGRDFALFALAVAIRRCSV